MPKRTPYGKEMLGKLKGFKNYLETAEKDRLEALVMENPNYFYDILPYTYVLGVSDIWMKKFEEISLEPPIWDDRMDRDSFDISIFEADVNSTMRDAKEIMTTKPYRGSSGGSSDSSSSYSSSSSSSYSSSSSSGGGSSGRGSGGGGGRSW